MLRCSYKRMLRLGALAAFIGAVTPGLAAGLPDGRRYEMVTPIQKNSADVLANFQRTRAAASGDAIQFASLTGFGDVHGGSRDAEYIAVRSPDGVWRTHGITPTQEPGAFFPDIGAGLEARYVGEFSSDLSKGIFLAKSPLTNAPNVAHAVNLYLRTNLLASGPGAYQLLTDAVTDQGSAYEARVQPALIGTSADFSHVLFESPRSLTAETVLLGDGQKVYEWVNGSVRFVGMIPAGTDEECGGSGPACAPSVSTTGARTNLGAYTLTNLSTDGRRAIFNANGALYLRDDQNTPTLTDDTTVKINASERSSADVSQDARFWAASSDGSKIFFTTRESLINDDPNSSMDLYRYDLDAGTGTHLVRISIDSEPADNQGNDVANGHNVAGAVGVDADGDTAYFIVTGGQLVAGGPISPPVGNAGGFGDARVYYWHAGILHEVGGINAGPETGQITGSAGWGVTPQWSRMTPDGRHLVFLTKGTDQLLSHYGKPEYNHGDTCSAQVGGTPACTELYVYDADANAGNGDLRCASCNPIGLAARGDAEFYVHPGLGATLDASHLNHPLSDDGRYVFFNSNDRLVSADKNDECDPYEYNTHTGELSLLSSGTSNSPSIFLDASTDGRDAFFLTRSRLRSEDKDESADLYNARIGGTIDSGPPVVHSCEEEGCRPPAVATAAAPTPASRSFQGPRDRLAPPNPPGFFYTVPLTPRQRRHLVTAGATQLQISASQGGTITVRVLARTNGKQSMIEVVHRTLKRSATIHPRIRLTPAARHALAVHHRLRLTIITTYSQTSASQTIRATLIVRR